MQTALPILPAEVLCGHGVPKNGWGTPMLETIAEYAKEGIHSEKNRRPSIQNDLSNKPQQRAANAAKTAEKTLELYNISANADSIDLKQLIKSFYKE